MPFTPEQLVDELYGPPQKEGQKKLEDFRKKNIPKPEKGRGGFSVIQAEDPEGNEIVFDMEKIKEESLAMFDSFNLPELKEGIEGIEGIELMEEDLQSIRKKSKEGFNRFYLLPQQELQKQHLQKIRDETGKPMPGLIDAEQYNETPDGTGQTGVWLSDTVKPNFPGNLQTLNRPPNKPYLLFMKDVREPDTDTLNKSPDEMRQILGEKQETGLTLAEYLLFQGDYILRNKNHPDHRYYIWLLDEESPQGGGSARVLRAYWRPVGRQVRVLSLPSGSRYPSSGCRSSAIFIVE